MPAIKTKSRVRKRYKTARPELPGPRRRSATIHPVSITLDDLRKAPGRLLGLGDLVMLGVVSSYEAYYKQSKAGVFPTGRLMPSGFLSWEAKQILDWYDALPHADRSNASQLHRLTDLAAPKYLVEETSGDAVEAETITTAEARRPPKAER